MSGTKSKWKSRGFWGGLVAGAAGVLALLGVDIPVADQVVATEHLWGAAGAIGGIVALIGRFKATKVLR